jgi:hypothetical protein
MVGAGSEAGSMTTGGRMFVKRLLSSTPGEQTRGTQSMRHESACMRSLHAAGATVSLTGSLFVVGDRDKQWA